ncbi:MAG: hypothetical protein IKJ65_01930 [Clostridia bacterium]|nr:hypothetical protein [Clostridia bacterium]
MTVREVLNAVREAKEVKLCFAGEVLPFNRENKLMVDAFANYIVDKITAADEDYIEIDIAAKPLKVGEA